jgi:AraC-like DNA-binding protein
MLPPAIYPARVDSGFVRHESPYNGTFDVTVRAPVRALRPFIDAYQGYVDHTPGVLARRELPLGRVVLVLSFGEPYRIGHSRTGEVTTGASFVAGLHDAYVSTQQLGPTAGMQVNLTPWGAYLLLQRPMHELANRTVALDDVVNAWKLLTPRLAEAENWDKRFALLEDALLARMSRAHPLSPGIVWAWRQLEASRGSVSIGALAERLGWSRKHLAAKFREQIGLPPKTAARVLRFHQTVGLIERGAEMPWAAIAMRSGYYDQAHFIRDFTEFAGQTPTEFLANRGV